VAVVLRAETESVVGKEQVVEMVHGLLQVFGMVVVQVVGLVCLKWLCQYCLASDVEQAVRWVTMVVEVEAVGE